MSEELPVYDDFGSREQLAREFGIKLDELNGLQILYAWYSLEGYEGWAHVVVRNEQGELFDCESAHCSCDGLDWALGPTTLGALKMYPTKPRWKGDEQRPNWDKLIAYLEHENNGN